MDEFSKAAGICVRYGLLEVREIGLDIHYRVTKMGRRMGHWGYGNHANFKKRAVFFLLASYAHTKAWLSKYKLWTFIVISAAAGTLLKATQAWGWIADWVSGLNWGAWAAIVVTLLITAWQFILKLKQ